MEEADRYDAGTAVHEMSGLGREQSEGTSTNMVQSDMYPSMKS